MIPIYNHPNPTPAMEEALHQRLLQLSQQEGYLDSKYRQILVEGFRYERSVMDLVQHVADEGGTPWHDRGPIARKLADDLGYTASANLMAAVREAVSQGLLSATVRDAEGWLAMTDYGWEILDMWEGMDDGNTLQDLADADRDLI
mgnify:CR=1 FL=1